jgi:hypothetical protein
MKKNKSVVIIVCIVLAMAFIIFPGIRVPLPNDSDAQILFPDSSLKNKAILSEIQEVVGGGVYYPKPFKGNPSELGAKYGKEIVPYAVDLAGDRLFFFSMFPLGHCNIPCTGTWRTKEETGTQIIMGITDKEAIPYLKRVMFGNIGLSVRAKLAQLDAKYTPEEVYKVWEKDRYYFLTDSANTGYGRYDKDAVSEFMRIVSKLDDSERAEVFGKIVQENMCNPNYGRTELYPACATYDLKMFPFIFQNLGATKSEKILEILKQQYAELNKAWKLNGDSNFATNSNMSKEQVVRITEKKRVYDVFAKGYEAAISQLVQDLGHK